MCESDIAGVVYSLITNPRAEARYARKSVPDEAFPVFKGRVLDKNNVKRLVDPRIPAIVA